MRNIIRSMCNISNKGIFNVTKMNRINPGIARGLVMMFYILAECLQTSLDFNAFRQVRLNRISCLSPPDDSNNIRAAASKGRATPPRKGRDTVIWMRLQLSLCVLDFQVPRTRQDFVIIAVVVGTVRSPGIINRNLPSAGRQSDSTDLRAQGLRGYSFNCPCKALYLLCCLMGH